MTTRTTTAASKTTCCQNKVCSEGKVRCITKPKKKKNCAKKFDCVLWNSCQVRFLSTQAKQPLHTKIHFPQQQWQWQQQWQHQLHWLQHWHQWQQQQRSFCCTFSCALICTDWHTFAELPLGKGKQDNCQFSNGSFTRSCHPLWRIHSQNQHPLLTIGLDNANKHWILERASCLVEALERLISVHRRKVKQTPSQVVGRFSWHHGNLDWLWQQSHWVNDGDVWATQCEKTNLLIWNGSFLTPSKLLCSDWKFLKTLLIQNQNKSTESLTLLGGCQRRNEATQKCLLWQQQETCTQFCCLWCSKRSSFSFRKEKGTEHSVDCEGSNVQTQHQTMTRPLKQQQQTLLRQRQGTEETTTQTPCWAQLICVSQWPGICQAFLQATRFHKQQSHHSFSQPCCTQPNVNSREKGETEERHKQSQCSTWQVDRETLKTHGIGAPSVRMCSKNMAWSMWLILLMKQMWNQQEKKWRCQMSVVPKRQRRWHVGSNEKLLDWTWASAGMFGNSLCSCLWSQQWSLTHWWWHWHIGNHCKKVKCCWFRTGMPIGQPKWHVNLHVHLLEQVLWFGGSTVMTDDFIEKAQQPWKGEKERSWNMQKFEHQDFFPTSGHSEADPLCDWQQDQGAPAEVGKELHHRLPTQDQGTAAVCQRQEGSKATKVLGTTGQHKKSTATLGFDPSPWAIGKTSNWIAGVLMIAADKLLLQQLWLFICSQWIACWPPFFQKWFLALMDAWQQAQTIICLQHKVVNGCRHVAVHAMVDGRWHHRLPIEMSVWDLKSEVFDECRCAHSSSLSTSCKNE